MRKKAQGNIDSVIVTLIILLVSLAVLVLVYNEWGKTLLEDATKRNCQWNLLLSSITKSPILSTETIPPDCKMTRKNITLEQLEKKKKSNKKEIEKFNAKYEDSKYVYFHTEGDKGKVNRELLEYEMDRIIANEIKDCWSVAWMGKMPIFQEWWSLIECDEDKITGEYKCDCKKEECSLGKEIIEKVQFWNNNFATPPAFCLLCSRIKFDQETQDKFGGKEITSLPEWMQKHPVLVDPQKRSYYEYTKDDVNRGIFFPRYVYNVDEPLAVVYSRINVYQPVQYGERIWEGISSSYEASKPINVLSLMPYSEVSEKCTYIIG